MDMKNTIPFSTDQWLKIVDYYFDEVHWDQDGIRNLDYNTPGDWVYDKYGCRVDMLNKYFMFEEECKRNWFTLRWS